MGLSPSISPLPWVLYFRKNGSAQPSCIQLLAKFPPAPDSVSLVCSDLSAAESSQRSLVPSQLGEAVTAGENRQVSYIPEIAWSFWYSDDVKIIKD